MPRYVAERQPGESADRAKAPGTAARTAPGSVELGQRLQESRVFSITQTLHELVTAY